MPENEDIVVHGWYSGSDQPFVMASRNFTGGGIIPASFVRTQSRHWRTQKLSSKPRWKKIHADNVVVYGDVRAADLKAIGVYALLIKDMIAETLAEPLDSVTFRIRIFASKQEFCVHAARCGAANAQSFYDPRTQEISMWFDSSVSYTELQKLLAHEFTHAYMDIAFGVTSPLWIAEGAAEYFSNFIFRDDHLISGEINPGSIAQLQREAPIPLDEFFALPRHVFYGADFERIYAQAWALVYYLIHERYDEFFDWIIHRKGLPEISEREFYEYLADLLGYEVALLKRPRTSE